MTKNKTIYIARIRDDSAYSTFRFVVNFLSALTFIVAALSIIWGFFVLFLKPSMIEAGVVALVGGVVAVILGKVSQEVTLMLADIADSIIDANSSTQDSK